MPETQAQIRYVYGPVKSWRSGTSLGIDPIGEISTCSFNCSYCQLGKIQNHIYKIDTYVPTQRIIQDLKELEKENRFAYSNLDVITFAGSGEPTLAENLGEIIDEIKKLTDVDISILTNATTLNEKAVRERVLKADLVSLKLDAPDDTYLKSINQAAEGVSVESIISGIKLLKAEIATAASQPRNDLNRHREEQVLRRGDLYDEIASASPRNDNASSSRVVRGDLYDEIASASPRNDIPTLQIQIMFLEKFAKDETYIRKLCELLNEIEIFNIQINTPSRPKPVSKTGEYWIETRGNHYSEKDALTTPDYIEYKELPVIDKETAFALEAKMRSLLKKEANIVNVYQ
jgi:wyosine [tRNA(Phe)-imidazoG37] synthetase (radical SAM superfamily)